MNILVIGNGGRESAIIHKLLQSSRSPQIFCAPGIDALADRVTNTAISVTAVDELKKFAEDISADLTIVGPEAPLVEGIVDVFEAAGLPIVGPSKAAAELEASKAFSKEIMKKYGIPTASYETFTSHEHALAYVRSQTEFPIVIKASGLAAGKGVVIPESLEEAERELAEMMLDKKFGASGDEVVIESFLKGEEASVFALCDGNDFVLLSPAQDHKRIGEGDTGKNTGGMGAYAPAPVVTADVLTKVSEQIIVPLLRGMKAEGAPYSGILFVGLMIDDGNPSVVEFNVRFGDPETQVVLPLLKSDFVELCQTVAAKTVASYKVELHKKHAMTVVLASGGYPDSYEKGKEINGLGNVREATVHHAGTKNVDDIVVTNGGRVLNVVAVEDSLSEAAQKAYGAIDEISFDKMYFRRDIGHRVLGDA